MEQQKLTTEEINAWRSLQFTHGLKRKLRDECRARGRTTTTYNLIRDAFDPARPDTAVQKSIREIALHLIAQSAVHETAN